MEFKFDLVAERLRRGAGFAPASRALHLLVLGATLACRTGAPGPSDTPPPPPPARLLPFLGEYGTGPNHYIVLEREGKLAMHSTRSDVPLLERGDDRFVAENETQSLPVAFKRSGDGSVTSMVFAGNELAAIPLGPASGNQLLVTPVRPLDVLRREAMAASPPVEPGPFQPTDLVELVKLDTSIHLEIRYATTNNFLGTPFYTQARAFLQRSAAEALARASAALKPRGFGLLIHDGYRPWYVTKMFWEATPPAKRIFVADPAQGSRHNRGAAVDLTLYDLKTGKPVEMVSTYDETTDRAAPDYPGGTSRQRWHRDLLRRVMEAQGFAVNANEWWHFDHADWRSFAIGNQAFEAIP